MPRKTTRTLVWRAHLFVECKAAKQRGDVERVQSGHVVRKGHADVLRRIVARGARARAAHRERHRLRVQRSQFMRSSIQLLRTGGAPACRARAARG